MELKMHLIPLQQQQKMQDMFKREVQLLAQIDHGSIPNVTDYFVYQDQHCMIMDKVAGEDLKRMLDDKEFTEEEVIDISRQLL